MRLNIKRRIKNVLCCHPQYSAQSVINSIIPYSTVSFDIFDTLIKRNVGNPLKVFSFTADLYNIHHQDKIDRDKFKSDRIEAETYSRQVLCNTGREEVTLEEIYSHFPDEYSRITLDRLMEYEIEAEIKCCHANKEIKKVFEYCVKEHKKIYIISDIYLPERTVIKILRNCGYENYQKLFLSSSYNVQKRSGNLFRFFINETGINPNDYIHIGDDYIADFIEPFKVGLKTKLIARNSKRSRFIRKYALYGRYHNPVNEIHNIANSCIETDWDNYFCFGFECLGPFLCGICQWIHNDAKRDGIEHIFFMARDGYIIQKAYNTLYKENAVNNSYLYVSRRALIVPQYWISPGLKEFQKLSTSNIIWKFDNIADQLGIEREECHNAWNESGIGDDEFFYNKDLEKDERVVTFFEKIENLACSNSIKECDKLLSYLNQEGFNGNVGIVDMGWRGTIQKCIERILNKKCIDVNIKGYYIGLMKGAEDGIRATTYFPNSYIPNVAITMMMEFFFSAPEGSTLNYEVYPDGRVYPNLKECEYEPDRELVYLQKIHDGALKFVQCLEGNRDLDRYAPFDLTINLLTACRHPRKTEIDMFADIQFLDKAVYFMASPKKLRHYILHLKELKKDFWESGWKIGFLKRLLLLPLPYYEIYNGLRNLAENKKQKG